MVTNFIKVVCVAQYPENKSTVSSDLITEVSCLQDMNKLDGIYVVSFEHNQRYISYTTLTVVFCSEKHMVHNQPLIQ